MMTNFPRLLWYLAFGLRRLRWDSRTLQKYQEKRLRSVVNHAYHFVPFYHTKFKRAGIFPAEIKTLTDLSKLPVVTKDEIRHENPLRLVSRGLSIEKLKVVKTSGSTGRPFQVYLSGAEDDWRKAIYMRANISCGQRPRDRWVVVTIPRHAFDTTPIQRKFGLFAQTCVDLYEDISEQVKLVREAKPDVLDGYSGWLFLLAKEARKEKMEAIKPRMIFGSAEFIDTRSMRFIERSFNAPYYDQFGCSEVDRTAWQCPEKAGYHMDVDSVITEFLDSEKSCIRACSTIRCLLYVMLSATLEFLQAKNVVVVGSYL
jgi:phenylacetate-CoA ligase